MQIIGNLRKISVITSLLEDAEDSYHKPVILHCAFCVLITRFQLTFFSNFIIITIIITIINTIIIITIITIITLFTFITICTIIAIIITITLITIITLLLV